MRQTGAYLFALLICAAQAAAPATPNDAWERVGTIAAGTELRVETAAGKREGRLVSANDTGITLRRGDAPEETIARADVRRVRARQGSHRMRNTIIGSAIGLGAGAIVYGTLGGLLKNEGAEGVEVLLLLPAAAGALIGAALPAKRMVTVYQVPRR